MINPRLIVPIAAFVVAFLSGWTIQGWRADAAQLAAVKRAITQADDIAQQDDEIATRFEAEKIQLHTVFRTIEEKQDADIAINPDYRLCGLSPAGVVLWNAANAGRLPSDPGQPDAAVSYSGLPPHWGFSGTDQEPPIDNPGLAPDLRATERPASSGEGA